MFGRVARRYDLANHLLSGGLDFWWRQRASDIVREWQPRQVLDLATGSGDLALAIARKLPEAEITGADFCAEMLEVAQSKGLTNTVVADALQLPFPAGSFDVVTVAFGLRNMADWSAALGEMGGSSVSADIFWCSIFRCRRVSCGRSTDSICTVSCHGSPVS